MGGEATIGIKKRRRRARSAPAGTRIKKSMIEDYYRVDRVDADQNVVLPGVPSYDADWSRDVHDFFNLIILIPVVVLNALNWNWDILLSFSGGKSLEDAWTGDWNNIFYNFTLFYFGLDLIWVMLVPHCVKSPFTIIVHHILCITYCSLPLFIPKTYYIMGLCMSVEANTWFLIARRVFNKQGFSPWTISLPPLFSIRVKLISIFFYLTWVLIRIIVYPSVVFKLINLYDLHRKNKYIAKYCLVATMFQLALCFLNLKWTRDLAMAKIRFWRHKKKSIDRGL